MDSNLVRQSLKLGLSVLITCAMAHHFQRVIFLWYPLLAVIFVVDEEDENTLQAARGRILGTVAGGLVAFIVHTILTGWMGILVSLLISIPLLRRLGWTSGLSTAAVITILFLGIPDYARLNWDYVFNRSVDTVIGIVVALVMSRLLWPKNRLARLTELDALQKKLLQQRLNVHQQALKQGEPAERVNAGPLTHTLLEMERLVSTSSNLPSSTQRAMTQQRWRQRMLLWHALHTRLFLMERLMERYYRQHDQPSPQLSRQFDRTPPLHWERLQLTELNDHLPALRIALEGQITELRWLMRSQARLEQAITP
ncbi:aromatic acid exporter family protein [Synechococcus sp. RS9916]|uniref:FUSC family protein n=1 Tax=Synechococcus sp. RS9916 TaxID=221359 RepID=UPI0002FB538D|nr:aromatic acid exporter family protein [Synechococcus sp. RS9916]